MATRQFTGKTVDEATDLALETLSLNREEVEIVVVNPGRSGILGFGGEPAVIQVTPIDEKAATSEAEKDSSPVPEPANENRGEEVQPTSRARPRRKRAESGSKAGAASASTGVAESGDDRDDSSTPAEENSSPANEGEAGSERTATVVAETSQNPDESASDDVGDPDFSEDHLEKQREQVERQPGPDPEVESMATELLDYFLGTMGVVASTYIREDTEDGSVAFDIEGEDAGLLIGRRGETLQALQFLVNMIINRQLGRPAYVTIDVEGYRERRQESLRSLADRTAARVASSGKPFTLQPMSAADRRIIHLALADHSHVRTESRGESDQRKVVVLPKR